MSYLNVFKSTFFYQFYSFLVFSQPLNSLSKGQAKELIEYRNDTPDFRKAMYSPVYKSLSLMTSVWFQGC